MAYTHIVNIHKQTQSPWLCPVPLRHIKTILIEMLIFCSPTARCIDIHIVHDAYMAHIQKIHMACQGPTNILSFPSSSTATLPHSITDNMKNVPDILILSVDTLQRECFLYAQNPTEHLIRLLAHGVAHLLGFDHSAEMFALCTKLERVGIAVC